MSRENSFKGAKAPLSFSSLCYKFVYQILLRPLSEGRMYIQISNKRYHLSLNAQLPFYPCHHDFNTAITLLISSRLGGINFTREYLSDDNTTKIWWTLFKNKKGKSPFTTHPLCSSRDRSYVTSWPWRISTPLLEQVFLFFQLMVFTKSRPAAPSSSCKNRLAMAISASETREVFLWWLNFLLWSKCCSVSAHLTSF